MNIPVLIPMAIGQHPVGGLIEGLKMQSVSCFPVLCYANGVVDSQRVYSEARTIGEALSRKVCQDNAKKYSSGYILSMDSDVRLTDNNAVKRLVEVLNSDDNTGAVSLYFGKRRLRRLAPLHVDMKCILYRKNLFINIDFSVRKGCLCNTSMYFLKQQGYITRYVSDEQLAVEIGGR